MECGDVEVHVINTSSTRAKGRGCRISKSSSIKFISSPDDDSLPILRFIGRNLPVLPR